VAKAEPSAPTVVRDLRPVADLVLLPDNPRHGDIGALVESLARFGQQKPIVVNSEGVILAGNHTYQAAVALGWEAVWVTESELEGREQSGFALADNRLSDLATYDHEVLLGQLKTLDDLTGTGYDTDDMDELLAKALHDHHTGLAPKPSFPEQLMNWEAQGGTRSVVLLYEIEDYRRVVARLKELATAWGLETNSEVVKRLVEDSQ
jgi:hypothetical protein